MKRIRIASFFIGVLFLVFLIPAGSMATNASISASGNEGLVTVSASAGFSSYTTCDENDPPNCTSCNSGSLSAFFNNNRYCGTSGNGSADCTFTLNAAQYPNGVYPISATASDCGGGGASGSDTIEIDNTPIVTAVNPGAVSGPFSLDGTAEFKACPGCAWKGYVFIKIYDSDGSLYRNNQLFFNTTNPEWTMPYSGHQWPNGTYNYEVYGQAAGNGSQSEKISGQFEIDNTPVISVENPGAVISGTFSLNGTAEFKACPGCAWQGYVFINIYDSDGSLYRSNQLPFNTTNPEWTMPYSGHQWPNGTYNYEVYGQAPVNQSQSEKITGQFEIDNTPIVSVDNPGTVSGSFSLQGTVEFKACPGCPWKGSVFINIYKPDGSLYQNTRLYFATTNENWNNTYPVYYLPNGNYKYEVYGEAAVNKSQSEKIVGSFDVDNTPEIKLSAVSQAEGKFDVTGTVTFIENPGGLEGYVYLYMDGNYLVRKIFYSTNNTFKFSDIVGSQTLNSEILSKGIHIFKAVAQAYNQSQATDTVEVENIDIIAQKNMGAANGICMTAPYTANPINFATGNKYKRQTDVALAGPGLPMAFTRHYNSQLEFEGALGYGWTGSYSDSITVSAGTIILRQSDGRQVNFIDDGSGRYLTETDGVRTFEAQADGYTLTEPDGTQKSFDVNGLLTGIRDPNGNTQTISRTDGNISTVSDNFGKTFGFEYNPAGRLSSLTTPVGAFTYSYDAAGNLDRVDKPDAAFRTYSYDDPNDPHNLTAITNENGTRSLSVTYDGKDRALTSELAGGAKRVRVDYHNHFQRSVTDSLENTTTFQLYVSKGIARVKSSSGAGCSNCLASLEDSYELSDRLLIDSKTDAESNRTDYTYDDRGRLLTKTEAVGTAHERTTGYSWHPVFNRIAGVTRSSAADADQTTTTTFEYDPAGNLLAVSSAGFDGTNPVSRSISYTYNANGRILTADGPRTDVNDVTTFSYYPNDAAQGLNRGRLHQISNSLGQQILYADYSPWGKPQTMTDTNGIVTTVEFDAAGRIKASTRNEKTTFYAHDSIGNLLSVTLPSGRVIGYRYDDAGWVEKITDNMGNTIRYAYDSEGNRIREQIHDVDGQLTSYTEFGYDEYNRLANVFYPGGDFEDYYRDKNGNLTGFVDAGGKAVSRGYDPLNRLATFTQPGQVQTFYDYDAHDNLIQVTDPNGRQTVFTFNDFGDRVAEDSPDAGLTVYTYDAAGNLTSKTDANNITVTYAYDALNRLTGIYYPDAAQNVSYRYDEQENGQGRLTSMTDPSGSFEYRYDVDGNLAVELLIIEGRLYTTEYQYDPTGILTGITYPNGRQVDYELDDAGRVIKVTTTFAGLASVVADNLSYLPFGPLAGYDAGGTTRIDKAHDMRYRLTGISAGTLLDLGYALDPVGNVTQITDSVDPIGNATFGYDDLYRLTSAAGVHGTIGYTYDDVGNRLTRTQNGQTDTYQYIAGTNRLWQISGENAQSFTYDQAGNLTAAAGKSFAYDQNNRLIRASEHNTTVGDYVYSAGGQRIKKTTADGTTIFHYDQAGNIIGESTPQGDFSAVYIYLGSLRLAAVAATALDEIDIKVTTSEGRALAGITVCAFTEGGAYIGKKAVTDEAGKAVFNPAEFAPGSYRFRADYLGDRFWSDVMGLPGTVSSDIVVAEEPVTVQVTQAGTARTGVKVYLFNEVGSYLGVFETTDENGQVTFVLPSGQGYKFRADVLGSRFMSEILTVQPQSSNVFSVATGGGRLTVKLQNQDTTPLSGISLYLFNADGGYLGLKGQSDTAGQVYFDVPAGLYRVRADYLGHQFWTADIAVASDHTADLTIAHADVTVTVAGDWDGDIRPLEALPVYLFSAAGNYLGTRQTTDALGQVVFSLPAEDYQVRVDYQKQQHWSQVFNHTDQTVAISEAVAEVRVTGQGLPLTAVSVYAFNGSGAYLGLTDSTDADGRVRFRLPAGDYDFRADYLGNRYFSGNTTLIAHVANPVGISTGGGNLTFKVEMQPQSPLTGISCYLFSAAGSYLGDHQVTGGAGEAQFHLADGDYKIRLDYLGYRYWTDAFSIPAISALAFAIPHQDVTVTVSGDYDGDVRTPAGVSIYLFDAAGSYMGISRQTDASGQAVFNLPAAGYQVRADYLNQQYWSDVFIAADAEITIDEGLAAVQVSQAGKLLDGVQVYAFSASGSYLGISGTTDTNGLVSFRLPRGTYKFRADHQGSRFWATSQVEGHVVNDIALATGGGSFVLRVQKDTAEVLSGIPVYVFSAAGKYLGINATSNAAGEVSFDLADGDYRFRADYLGYQYWTADLTVADVLSEVLTISHQDVTVTVNEVYGYDTTPIAGIPVYVFTAAGSYQRITAATDVHGQVVFNLPQADYKIRADYLAGQFWSQVFNGTDVVLDIGHGLAAVHVTDIELDLFDVPVYLFNEAGKYLGRVARTDSAGMASFLVPEGSYKFRVDTSGSQVWSDTVHVLTDEQIDIEMDAALLLSDLTTNPSPVRFDGTPPAYEPQAMMVASLGSLTGILPALITSRITVDRLYFYINDHLGTPRIVVDDAGEVVWVADYNPFGAVDVGLGSSVANNFRFTGQYFDVETGLHYNWHRYYDPTTGRYLTPDPIGLAGGINLYAYVSNNPVNAVDPWGLRAGSAVRPGVRWLDPSGHPVFHPGSYENQLIANDLTKIIGLMDPRPLLSDIIDLFDSDNKPYCEAKGNGDPPIIYDPNDLGPLYGAPGLSGWKNPQNIPPEDPDYWKKPSNWKNMSKWEKFKWYIKKVTMSGGSSGGVGS